MQPEDLFAGHPHTLAVHQKVRSVLEDLGPVQVRTSKSQVAFRRRRGFAYVWRPGQYLGDRGAEAVLSIVLDRHDPSPRFKEVTHPAPAHWMHHLEVGDPSEIDEEVAAWLAEAAERAG
jgi:hypothetical protein